MLTTQRCIAHLETCLAKASSTSKSLRVQVDGEYVGTLVRALDVQGRLKLEYKNRGSTYSTDFGPSDIAGIRMRPTGLAGPDSDGEMVDVR